VLVWVLVVGVLGWLVAWPHL